MSTGLGVFIACMVLCTAWAAVMCVLTARTLGGSAAAREAAVLALSLAAYAGVCLWLGYSIGAQCLAAIASAVPLLAGRRYVPSVRRYFGEQ